ncbi:Spy/CpxP family protein refolding chaperone [Paraferrimonas sedimenticola]|uniref:Periplasmic heavy metal sensor n=1 Tax=Paraferrimonas sedimenticola TaxID=375674 RepID=A0AA37RYP0_9GAMM|nr:Spy/CpxP family protein refolding chaperone [Paraferrimonas sedimenticola]GLP97598.1 hypothetical protein GCM10007895_29050 [Paraferrimonas sedimenticola]
MKAIQKTILALSIVGVSALAPQALAEEPSSERGYHSMDKKRGFGSHRHLLRGLDLTEEQKTSVKDIMAGYAEQAKDRSEERQDYRAELQAVVTAESFDENAARSLIEAQQSERVEAAVRMLAMQSEIYQILTPEQQEKFKESLNNSKQRSRNR